MLFLILSFSISSLKLSIERDEIFGIILIEKLRFGLNLILDLKIYFSLHEGTKVQLMDSLQEWKKIKIANGSRGMDKRSNYKKSKLIQEFLYLKS